MRASDAIILIVLFIALAGSLYFLWMNLPGNQQEFQTVNLLNQSGYNYSASIQFYPNMRYPDKQISFSIASACDDKKTNDALTAFSLLANETILKFYEVSDNGQIAILCSNISPEPQDASHFVAGEGGPKDIYVSGPFYVITSGKVSLYRTDNCANPNIATHEILHALGFDHNYTNQNSIMYPVTSCSEQLDQYIIDYIDKIYSIKSAPDLAIVNATASKSGAYLSFQINVANDGLRDANDAVLSVYSQDTKVKDYDIGALPLGEKKKVSVENLIVPRNTNEIKFTVSLKDNGDEISYDNNQIDLVLTTS